MPTLIAFDTATERMSVALAAASASSRATAKAARKASTTLLPAIFGLLAEAGIALADLDAIAFGRGPGAFTGLRTACSVAQGLAFGAGKRVLPIDSLLAVAEDARAEAGVDGRVWAVIDARMDQIYAAEYEHADGRWTTRVAPFLTDLPSALARAGATIRRAPSPATRSTRFGARLDTARRALAPAATPNARALLRLAERGLGRRRRRRSGARAAALRARPRRRHDAERARPRARRAAAQP